MKYLKRFFESKENIDLICKEYYIKNYTINSDGTIDVIGDVDLFYCHLIKLPLKFGKVTGNFNCGNNKLTSLEGSPREVVGGFYCQSNQLTTLKGSPIKVGGDFTCTSNKLISLEGCTKKVGGTFTCYNNQLTSLIGCPEIIGRNFYCDNNNIKDFKGISEFFDGKFYCGGNPIWEIYSLFNDVKCIRWINEFDVIVDGEKVILDRLEEVFHQLGMNIKQNIQFKHYEII
jgi:hypothetical protein